MRGARAAGKSRIIPDGGGLYLRVFPRGTKSWVFRTQRGGKDRWKALGRYPAMTLTQARQRAADSSARGFVAPTVAEAYAEYRLVIKKRYASFVERDRRFKKDVIPALGAMPLGELTRRHCGDMLQGIVGRGAPVTANRTLPDLQQFLQWCVERGWVESNVSEGITRKSVGGVEQARTRVLSVDELGQLVSVLLSGRFENKTSLALALILLTGQRSSEVLGISRDDLVGPWWHMPAAKNKARRLHKVYLAPQARALLRVAFAEYGTVPFCGTDHRALSRAVKRMAFTSDFTPHDLRRTVATQLADAGIAPHVIEKLLNHRMEGVWAVYNRAEYLPERRAAWRLWGAYLAGVRRRQRTAQSRAGTPAVG